jgi:membrane-associated phospholipid phosphatase
MILRHNFKLIMFFDVLRDIILIFIIFAPLVNSLLKVLNKKRPDYIYFLEFLLVILISFSLGNFIKSNISSLRPISYYFPYEQMFDSFPSSHTMTAFSVSVITIISNFELGFFLVLFSILVAIFSWFSLSHWPIDILAGAFLGFLIAILVNHLVQSFIRFYIKKSKHKI